MELRNGLGMALGKGIRFGICLDAALLLVLHIARDIHNCK